MPKNYTEEELQKTNKQIDELIADSTNVQAKVFYKKFKKKGE